MAYFTSETYTAPSSWATYLINGDESGISDDDRAQADAFIAYVGLGSPVDCQDAGFIWRHEAYAFCPFGADCQEYTFLRPAVPPFSTVDPYQE